MFVVDALHVIGHQNGSSYLIICFSNYCLHSNPILIHIESCMALQYVFSSIFSPEYVISYHMNTKILVENIFDVCLNKKCVGCCIGVIRVDIALLKFFDQCF